MLVGSNVGSCTVEVSAWCTANAVSCVAFVSCSGFNEPCAEDEARCRDGACIKKRYVRSYVRSLVYVFARKKIERGFLQLEEYILLRLCSAW